MSVHCYIILTFATTGILHWCLGSRNVTWPTKIHEHWQLQWRLYPWRTDNRIAMLK